MLNPLEFEKQNLLDTTAKSQKKGVSKKVKMIALLNIIIIGYFAYSSFSTSGIQNKNLNLSGSHHDMLKHMKATINSDQMAEYHHKMRILMHAGALDDFNKYDKVVEDAKTKSKEAGESINFASTAVQKTTKMIEDLKSNPVGTAVGALSDMFSLRQKKALAKEFAKKNLHNFSFDLSNISKIIGNSKKTHGQVKFNSQLIRKLICIG